MLKYNTPLTLTVDDVNNLVNMASRLSNAAAYTKKINLLNEATTILQMIDAARRRASSSESVQHTEALLDQLEQNPGKTKAEIASGRRENSLRKQMVIDQRLAPYGIPAGSVTTWHDCEWLQAEASFKPRKTGAGLLAALDKYKQASVR